MIDFHTHILPGMDDGSKDVRESVSMLRLEGKRGIDTVCLTPHFYAEQNSPEQFLERRKRAWQKLKPCPLDMQLSKRVKYPQLAVENVHIAEA